MGNPAIQNTTLLTSSQPAYNEEDMRILRGIDALTRYATTENSRIKVDAQGDVIERTFNLAQRVFAWISAWFGCEGFNGFDQTTLSSGYSCQRLVVVLRQMDREQLGNVMGKLMQHLFLDDDSWERFRREATQLLRDEDEIETESVDFSSQEITEGSLTDSEEMEMEDEVRDTKTCFDVALLRDTIILQSTRHGAPSKIILERAGMPQSLPIKKVRFHEHSQERTEIQGDKGEIRVIDSVGATNINSDGSRLRNNIIFKRIMPDASTEIILQPIEYDKDTNTLIDRPESRPLEEAKAWVAWANATWQETISRGVLT